MKLQDMVSTLENWIDIGIGHDIVNFPEHRPEFQSYVKQAEVEGVAKVEIPQWVLNRIKHDIEASESKVETKVESPHYVPVPKKTGRPPGLPKSGGRQKGTPNRRSLAFGEVLADNGFSIPEKAIELFNKTNDEYLKLKLLEFLSPYAHSKLKDKEVESTDIEVFETEHSNDELLAIASGK